MGEAEEWAMRTPTHYYDKVRMLVKLLKLGIRTHTEYTIPYLRILEKFGFGEGMVDKQVNTIVNTDPDNLEFVKFNLNNDGRKNNTVYNHQLTWRIEEAQKIKAGKQQALNEVTKSIPIKKIDSDEVKSYDPNME